MDAKTLARWRIWLSWIALGFAAAQLIVACGVASLPPPETSEGGLLAGVFYALYYAIPLTLIGVGLRSESRWIVAFVGVLALGLVVLHSAPLLNLQFQEQPWQQVVAGVVSGFSGVLEAIVFVVAVATFLSSAAAWRRQTGRSFPLRP